MSQTDTKLKLLGCPFCVKPINGVSVCSKREEGNILDYKTFWVVCHDCGLKSPKFRSVSNLVAYWNTRVRTGNQKKETLMERLTRILWEPLKWHR